MVIVLIIMLVVNGAICGAVAQTIIEEKGYYENWFWYGFFFGEIAILAAKIKEEKHATSLEYTVPAYLTSGTSTGAASQPSHTAYSSAGVFHAAKAASASSGEWLCSKCGRINQGYTGSCACGMTKAENEAMLKAESEKAAKEANVDGALKEDGEIITAHRIKAYKELLDTGAITKEEFDRKKAELLGL